MYTHITNQNIGFLLVFVQKRHEYCSQAQTQLTLICLNATQLNKRSIAVGMIMMAVSVLHYLLLTAVASHCNFIRQIGVSVDKLGVLR